MDRHLATQCFRLLRSAIVASRRLASTANDVTSSKPPCPVSSFNEWDPLEEVIVGRAEGQRVPFLSPDLQAKTSPDGWKWIRENANRPHDPVVVQKAEQEVAEFCRILELEGVKVRRPEPIRWDQLGTFRTPYFEDGGFKNTCPRDGILVVGDEIIEAPMAWRSRAFEHFSYKTLLNEYFHQGARWTTAPRPTMNDELYVQDYPFEDASRRQQMCHDGQYILTESEPVFDAADAMRFGRDIFVTLSNATNRSGVEWLRRHFEPRGIRVHSLIYQGDRNCHADATFIPLKPGLLIVNPVRPCLKINDKPTGWEYFNQRDWKVVEVPPPITIDNFVYVSKWVHMNVLSLDTERVFIQRGEEPLKRLFVSLGMKPIEVDLRSAYPLGGAFHCWTVDVRRRGSLETYL